MNRCPGQIGIPTEKEKEALEALKSIKERVRELKKELSSLSKSGQSDHPGEAEGLKKELVRLKVEWDAWQEKRLKAEEERMILLGHESHGGL